MTTLHEAWLAQQRARWIDPNVGRWQRPDYQRYQRPLHPDELKYRADQPRVPAGSSEGGQWTTDGGGGGRAPINDPRVISDVSPDPVRPGDQYAQNRRVPGFLSTSGRPLEVTPAQAARLEAAKARADEAIARVREVDRNWRPQPSLYETAEGAIRAHEGETAQAQARAIELAGRRAMPGPYAGESIPARGPERDFSAAERREINRIGQETGCHSCGTLDPGTKRGNFVVDHQSPTHINPIGRAQRLYPHCLSCSGKQGTFVRDLK